jgi:PucR C-terminal helix-turn-helix domain
VALSVDESRPRLGRVIADLGTTLLGLVVGDPNDSRPVGGVVIWDPADEPDFPPGAFVLGIGLQDEANTATTLRELGARGATALVLRAPVSTTPLIADAAATSGVALLGLTRGASWIQLAAMVRSLIGEEEVGQAESGMLDGIETGDLFALANAITGLLDAPITIEDRNSRLLAFSGRQDEADQARVDAILGRQVPEAVRRVYIEKGVFRDLYRSNQPIWVDAERVGLNQLPRVVVAVRAGDEMLGSVWAAVREPLSEERTQALVEAAKVVALHLLRVRAGADVQRRVRSDLVSTALEGGREAGEALSRLGLTDKHVMLFALEVLRSTADERTLSDDTEHEAQRQRISDAFAVHLLALNPRSASAQVGNITYGLVPTSRTGEAAEHRAVQIGNGFLDRVGSGVRAIVGVGPLASTPAEIAYSRSTAERVLRVLRASTSDTRRAARLGDVYSDALLLDLRDLAGARGDRLAGPLAVLNSYDGEHNTSLVATLAAWFDAFGDAAATSSALMIHPNTLRYRLKRIRDICGVDLADSNTRLAMMIELRMMRTSSPGSHS